MAPDRAWISQGRPTQVDLSAFDQTIRSTSRAGHGGRRAGIYASVMLFEGFSLHLTRRPTTSRVTFHAANNVNDIAITSIVDYQVLPLDARVEAAEDLHPQGDRHCS